VRSYLIGNFTPVGSMKRKTSSAQTAKIFCGHTIWGKALRSGAVTGKIARQDYPRTHEGIRVGKFQEESNIEQKVEAAFPGKTTKKS